MNFSFKYISLSILSCTTLQMYAQQKSTDSTFSTKKIDFYQEYVPEVKLPTKEKIVPSDVNMPVTPISKSEYSVPSQTLQYSYGAVTIRPLALQPTPAPKPFQNYAALGLGNYNTIKGDLALTHHEDGKYDVYFHGYHFSQKGGKIADSKSSYTDLIAGGKYFMNKYVIFGDISLNRVGSTYYGYDHDRYQFDTEDIGQYYTTIEVKGGLEKMQLPDLAGIAVQPNVNVYSTMTKKNLAETGFGFDVPVSYLLDNGIELGVGVSGLVTQFTDINKDKFTNNYLSIHPSLQYNRDKLTADVGFAPVTRTNEGWDLLPKINARYAIGTPARISLNAGWDGNVEMYSLRNLSAKNPFLYDYSASNAIHKALYGGIELALISNVKLEAKATYHTYDRYSVSVNDYRYNMAGNFMKNVYRNNVNVFEFYGGANILLANQFDLGANFSIYSFTKDYDNPIVHEPRFRLNGFMKVKPTSYLTIGATMNMFTGLDYITEYNDKESLPTIFDLGINAQVDFLKRMAAFVQIDNLLDNKYQRWSQYKAYGFNIFGGIKVKF